MAQQAVGVFVRPTLPRTLRVTKVHADIRRYGQRVMRGEFAAAISGQRSPQPLREPSDAPREGANHGSVSLANRTSIT
jgi:hypothetical protein